MQLNAKYRILLVFVILLIGFVFHTLPISAQTFGLKFKGQDVTLDKRTELNLTPDNYLSFQNEFEVSFDFKLDLNNPNFVFGYVVRIINEENFNVDLLTAPSPNLSLNVVVGKNNSIVPIQYSASAISNWLNLRVKFLLSEDRMVFYMPDTFYVQDNVGFKEKDNFKIIFGANDFGQFKTSDVPSMNIKNIRLSENGKQKYFWLLDEDSGNTANDKLKRIEAKVKNPIWLKQSHHSWQNQMNEEISGNVIYANDPASGRVFLIAENGLTIYSAEDNKTTQVDYTNDFPKMISGYKAIFNSNNNRLYCYIVAEATTYWLDIENGKWDKLGSGTSIESRYRHHNSYFNPENNSIYIFGGYGLHKYYNLIRRLDLRDNSRNDIPNDKTIFHPRYLAGMAELEDTLYFLGGYGSHTGDQLINPRSYFDLFAYSIKENKLFKKFEIPHLIDDMIVANTMWINEEREYYALINSKSTFEGQLQMINGNLDSPNVEFVGDSIPYTFLDIRSEAKLFYMPSTNKLYAYTSYFDDSSTEVNIYSIDNPPNISSVVAAKSHEGEWSSLYYIVAALFVLLTSGILLIVRRKKKAAHINIKNQTIGKDLNNVDVQEIDKTVSESINYNIILFGGFQVFNKEKKDITNKFSPLLKELFLLILLHTFKNEKGISSAR